MLNTKAHNAPSESSGICRLESVPPEDTISGGTEEVDQITPQPMPPTSPVEVDKVEQPDVLPVPVLAPEEADTSVSSNRSTWHNVQQLMPTLSRPAHGVGKCNTDEPKS